VAELDLRENLRLICNTLGFSRQAYYKRELMEPCKQEKVEQVWNEVLEIRAKLPNLGVRKLHRKMTTKIGRDALFHLLRDRGMLSRLRAVRIVTTNSKHARQVYPNLIKDVKVTAPNQVWVSDITYLSTLEGFCYLALVTDIFSRRIMGYHLSTSMDKSLPLEALKKAFLFAGKPQGLIHHSDKGSQYCSREYIEYLDSNGFSISMTGPNHCYDNAVAERVNGILKYEFELKLVQANPKAAKNLVANSVLLYNTYRPHLALAYKTPQAVYDEHVNKANQADESFSESTLCA